MDIAKIRDFFTFVYVRKYVHKSFVLVDYITQYTD